jgi:hypothetical protein
VFLTPEGDCQGLYVKSKGPKSFEVRELQEGTSGVRFSYRIVGKRKDITAHKRFGKIETRVASRAAELPVIRRRKAAHLTSRGI